VIDQLRCLEFMDICVPGHLCLGCSVPMKNLKGTWIPMIMMMPVMVLLVLQPV
jgi:hypothetical protein